jgi:hypothetical protein
MTFTPYVDGGDVDISINSDRHAVVESRHGTISGSVTGSSCNILMASPSDVDSFTYTVSAPGISERWVGGHIGKQPFKGSDLSID